MPSEAQLVELGKLVREARKQFIVYPANDNQAVGSAIALAQAMLKPWASQSVVERLQEDRSEADDLLNEAAEHIILAFASITAVTGKEFYMLIKTTVERLIRSQERRRFAFRRRCGKALSLDRDAKVARLAELLVDEQPGPELVAVAFELKGKVRQAMKGLTPDERRAARLMLQGEPLARIVEQFGVPMRAAWRRARVRLREALAAEAA